MACSSCGGGRQLTPNRQQAPQPPQQSQNRIVINRGNGGNGNKQFLKPNGEQKTPRTQV